MKLFFIITFSLILFSSNIYSQNNEIPIKGLWTLDRPPFGIDTLSISDSTIYYKFLCCDTIKVEWFGEIIPQKSSEYILYKRIKLLHNKRNVDFKDSLVYLQYEFTGKNLWTYSDTDSLSNRNYLKINAYRSTWVPEDKNKYELNITNTCDDKKVYSVYNFQKDITSTPFVTIPPKYKFGNDSLKDYIEQRLIYDKDEVKDIFMRLKYKFKVNCDGTVSNCQAVVDAFPDLSSQIKNIIESTVDWIPAISESHYVACETYISFTIRNNNVIPAYNY